MFTERLHRITAAGTGRGYTRIRLADGPMIYIKARPHSTELDEVYLAPGLTAPGTDDWEAEDDELVLTGESASGTLYMDVPAEAVGELITEHGGEHAIQDADFPPVGYQIHPAKDGRYPVRRGTQRLGYMACRARVWQVIPLGGTMWSGAFATSEEAADHLLKRAEAADKHSAQRAEWVLRGALAECGLPLTRGSQAVIGQGPTSWVQIDVLHRSPYVTGDEPYVLVYLRRQDDEEEMTLDRVVTDADEWVVLLGSGDDTQLPGATFTAADTAALSAYVVDWHRDPEASWTAALAADHARRLTALNTAATRY
ncbi:hypothetical protein OHS33_39360 (plasmid) [Streptomyces sp. NBC_00536]|uniref:hypothetical protein n=1 Tax=Streptomyces sp. NBC_00536 TaxID=2975769 RepID=UPI002E80CC0C|nr:hypothetical protein [Streptomyces sp. NBC_00536]WUC84514.1 hypothetical protein OHS33_39360 [Streptomyces sp. NBC_00536]